MASIDLLGLSRKPGEAEVGEKRSFHELVGTELRGLIDQTTGLANRRGFDLKLSDRRGRRRHFAILILDLDGFADVNHAVGAEAADEALCEVARRISTCVRASDLIARVGGDEFAVLLSDATVSDGRLIATRVLTALSNLEFEESASYPRGMNASIGIACGDPGADVDEVFRRAYGAMFEVKQRGGSGYVVAPLSQAAGVISNGTDESTLDEL